MGFTSNMIRADRTVYDAQRRVDADARARAKALSADAAAALIGYLALGLLVIAALVAAAVLAGRSITRPLDALAREADDVAQRRLPETVARIQAGELVPAEGGGRPPSSAQEISRVVAALHNVERTAVGLAAEQAVLRRNTAESLASLGRRSQGLVRRQLALITALEQQELDPEALAELFELDHLATRMRRNAESLLVLVDERSPQISSVTASSLELVQSAMGEVEQYRRVALAEIEPRRISGRAVAELSHLLAELVENALSFSPPDQPVDVHGWGTATTTASPSSTTAWACPPRAWPAPTPASPGRKPSSSLPPATSAITSSAASPAASASRSCSPDTPGGGVSALVTLPARILAPDEAPPPARRTHVSSMLNGFRAGVARAEAR
ncbi:hypothetical protein [Streptomyces mirabilis]|uniref:hypothetical protein n=1 Tax=Streptomyces mirabilis TaxID=68239 RepID=UPI002E2E753C|nr:hypothetical protein [Streptomyces mirabilis]